MVALASHKSLNVCVYLVSLSLSAGHSGGVEESDVTPSAPALDHMDQVYGYETTSFDAGSFFFFILSVSPLHPSIIV